MKFAVIQFPGSNCDQDCVRAIDGLLSEPAAWGNVFNVGSMSEISILELARRVLAVTGSASEVSLVPYDEAYAAGFEDMHRRVPDITKIAQLIGWSPTRSLEDIIRDVVADHERPRV